jgi:murein L,D-transpeptidase YafK
MRDSPTVELLVDKEARRLDVLVDGALAHSHAVRLGRNAAIDKAVEGDCATPLGRFYVCARNPRSKFYLSLCLSYPNIEDADRGVAAGLIGPDEHAQIVEAIHLGKVPPQHTRLGGEIYIHGEGPGGADPDGTRGCIALDNDAMREVYELAAIGTPVRIVTRLPPKDGPAPR